MKVLVACEFSGIVRDAFIRHGHDAISCDLLPSETPGPHYEGDIRHYLHLHDFPLFDLIIAHPPCTYLAVSGARWWKDRQSDQREAIRFFMDFALIAEEICPKVCIENPIGIMSRIYRKPNQIIQPWQFGHGETKATCLWTRGLPDLVPTNIVTGRENKIHRMPPSPDRWKNRSRTYQGIAEAMAEQWGNTNARCAS